MVLVVWVPFGAMNDECWIVDPITPVGRSRMTRVIFKHKTPQTKVVQH